MPGRKQISDIFPNMSDISGSLDILTSDPEAAENDMPDMVSEMYQDVQEQMSVPALKISYCPSPGRSIVHKRIVSEESTSR